MSDASFGEKTVRIGIRFVLAERYEVALETDAKHSAIGETVSELIKAIHLAQEDMAEAATAVDVEKFKPIELLTEDPMVRFASRLGSKAEKLRKMFLIEGKKVFVVCRREVFGARGGGEKAALTILYAYKYAFDRAPTNGEVSEAYQKLQFKPRAFAATVKSNLLKLGKISEKDDMIYIEPRATVQIESVIREILRKL